MRTLSVYNPRQLLLTQKALAPAGLWAIKAGYDTPLTLQHEEWDLSQASSLRLVVAGDPAHPLSRALSHAEVLPGALRVWWGRAEALAQYAGQTLPFTLEAEIGPRLLRLAEGEIEVER